MRQQAPNSIHEPHKAKSKPFIKVKRRDGSVTTARGREAQTLAHLIEAGPAGDTSLGFSNAKWARRTSGYVFDLRKLGFDIQTHMEQVEVDTRVARYVLAVDFDVLETGGIQSSGGAS
ncbi:helix-turn-helix domain-containing protein [Asticcacaulis sp. AC402]|uniref:winged helix domain-containing protein n=1 Tax=Asticcacaulis sp. AC402 TaxID=1282361 RepID=UPI00138AD44F|nr:helix-turn-helix domain-containing protein [Asticcacaulis sp. AC402]